MHKKPNVARENDSIEKEASLFHHYFQMLRWFFRNLCKSIINICNS